MTGSSISDMHRFPYRWRLSDGFPAEGMRYHGRKVLSCFSGGGGSSMGYKLAGYDVVGGVEIDGRMADCYERNLKPRFLFRGDIRDLVAAEGLPEELSGLDVLDGSPPCTSFSTAGKRERDWGKEKKFREGQKRQVLDTLFFDFIALAGRLRPKVVVAENVTGMLKGRAVKYCARIQDTFRAEGYATDWIILNSDVMGVPQSRGRLFFFGIRDDLFHGVGKSGLLQAFPDLQGFLRFSERKIPYREVEDESKSSVEDFNLHKCFLPFLSLVKPGYFIGSIHPKGSFFGHVKIDPGRPISTVTAQVKSQQEHFHYGGERTVNTHEYVLCSTFPLDYDFSGLDAKYVMGMSVPPVMMAQVALRVKERWLDGIDGR